MAMAFSKQTRKKMEDLIFNFFSKLDPSGKNTKKYKDFFGAMSDSQFQSFFNKFFQDKSAYLTLDIVTYEHDLSMKNIEDAAKFLGVPLFETVVFPDIDSENGKSITTSFEVPVGYIHMKAMQQMVRKKNSTSVSIDKRDPRTGQVTGDDKDVQFSIDENYGLMAHNAKACLKEFLSVRADDMVMKQEAYSAIRKNGYVSLNELTDNVHNKVALNTLNVYLLAMHIKTNIVDSGYLIDLNNKG
ncbi:MAG: hypothetical protein SPF22_08410 [Candidatus Onthovivens sp.]|nr:hypothetical protein [Candidatus Onthovivens sp.]